VCVYVVCVCVMCVTGGWGGEGGGLESRVRRKDGLG
jgi:hypothetical protein